MKSQWSFKDYEKEIRGMASQGISHLEIARRIKNKYGLKPDVHVIARRINRKLNPQKNKKGFQGGKSGERIWEEKNDSAFFQGVTREPITKKERAVEISGADLSIWECDHWLWNSWGMTNGEGEYHTNFQVKVWFKKRVPSSDEFYEALTKYIRKHTKPVVFKPKKKAGGLIDVDGIWAMSDFHLGLVNENNSVEALCNRLNIIADFINRSGRMRNHIFLGGDLLESGAGTLMHTSQIFEIIPELTGVSGIRAFYELFKKHFLQRLEVPLSSVFIVAGNHDRTAKNSSDQSPFGSMAEVLYHFLNDNLPDEIDVRYDFDQLQTTIQGIDYILTHGDNKSAQNLAMMIQDHGDPLADYHVLIKAHYHSRKTERWMKRKSANYEKVITVQEENLNFRAVQLPPLCLANGYAKRLGKSSGCGFYHIERSSVSDSVDHHDYSVP